MELEPDIEKYTRRRWTREETDGFLRCYLAHKAEFEHPRRKRRGYANVLADMISLGITDSERTPMCLEGRMRVLLAAHHNNQTSPGYIAHREIMEQIFGDKPNISNNHTLHLGKGPVKKAYDDESFILPTPMSPLPSSSPPMSPLLGTQSPTPATLVASAVPAVRRKRTSRDQYYEKKLKLKQVEIEEKKKQREEQFSKIRQMLKEKWEKDTEMEDKKLLLLENILKKKF